MAIIYAIIAPLDADVEMSELVIAIERQNVNLFTKLRWKSREL